MKTYLAGLLTRPRFTRLPIPTNRGSGKSTCANRLVGTHSSGSVRDFHPIPYYSVTRTRNGNQTLHINAAKIQYFFLTPTFLSVFFHRQCNMYSNDTPTPHFCATTKRSLPNASCCTAQFAKPLWRNIITISAAKR